MRAPLLAVEDLRVAFDTDEGTVRAVERVSFDVDRGETGAGKTVTGEAVTRLTPMPPGEVTDGSIRFDGVELTEAPAARLRGDRITHAFQNPQHLFDPVYTVGRHIVEAIRYHRNVPKARARERAADLLDRVGIPNAPARADDSPSRVLRRDETAGDAGGRARERPRPPHHRRADAGHPATCHRHEPD